MGIGSVTSMNSSMSGMQMTMARQTDSESKNIQNEITGVQQKMQELSSREELSVDEKENERKKLKMEMSSLNIELKQHQEELSRSRKREIMLAELRKQEDKKPEEDEKSEDKALKENTSTDRADTNINNMPSGIKSDDTDEAKEKDTDEEETKAADSDIGTDTRAGLSDKEMNAIVSADTSVRQAGRQGTVIARIRDGIVILKGEINQDKMRGTDTEKKREELEKLEKKEQRARASQFSVLGNASRTMKTSVENMTNGKNNRTQTGAENNAFINAYRLSREDSHASQQRFYISIGN